MRNMLLAIAIFSAGCAGTTEDRPATVAAVPAGTAELTPTPGNQVTEQRLAEARKLGYKIENQNGEEMFCRVDLQTGSHLQREKVCLTRKQIDDLRQQTQNGLANTLRQAPPPTGH